MEDKKQTVSVSIYGENYPIRGTADPDYIIRVASYLDGKMREVARQDSNRAPAKVAILAALNITDELFKAREATSHEAENISKSFEEKSQHIIDWLESRLSPQAAS
jgi:cell division protein ZapA